MCSVIDQFNENFSSIQFKIEFNDNINEKLLINLKKLKEKLTNFDVFMNKYNYQNVESNGYYSYYFICVQFQLLILNQLSKNNFNQINNELVDISNILLVFIDVMIELEESSNKGKLIITKL